MANKTNFFKVIYIYNTETLKSLYTFSCSQCINRKCCRKHSECVINCPVENELNNNKNIDFSHRATTFFGNQYFINQRRCFPVEKIFSLYTRQ